MSTSESTALLVASIARKLSGLPLQFMQICRKDTINSRRTARLIGRLPAKCDSCRWNATSHKKHGASFKTDKGR